MDVLVTGATGFAGANVARLLVAHGYRVRILARPASSLRALEGCPIEVRRGDVLEPEIVHMLARITGISAPRVRVPMPWFFWSRWRARGWPASRAARRASRSPALALRASACTSARTRRYESSGYYKRPSSRRYVMP